MQAVFSRARPQPSIIDLTTGTAGLVGAVGGPGGYRGLVVRALPPAPAFEATALTEDGKLVRFHTEATDVVVSKDITGLGGKGLGLDLRPSNGQLHVVADDNKIYTVNGATGAATLLSTFAAQVVNGDAQAIDFNPVAHRLRFINTVDGSNFRINVDTGALANNAPDKPLAFVAGDANEAQTPHVAAGAYLNNTASPAATTLYDIDTTLDALLIQDPPNHDPPTSHNVVSPYKHLHLPTKKPGFAGKPGFST